MYDVSTALQESYNEEITLLEGSFEFCIIDGLAKFDHELILVEGGLYTVVFDGEEYECIAYKLPGTDVVAIGSRGLLEAPPDNDEPFLISEEVMVSAEAGLHSIMITHASVLLMNEKYLPKQDEDFLLVQIESSMGDDGEIKCISNRTYNEVQTYEQIVVGSIRLWDHPKPLIMIYTGGGCFVTFEQTEDDLSIYTAVIGRNNQVSLNCQTISLSLVQNFRII